MPENPFMQGVQIGANIAGNRIEQSRRMQELRSMESLRKLQEQQVAQNLQLQMEQNNLAIQYRADMSKAMQTASLASSPIVPVVTQFGAMPAPNPQRMSQTDAAYRFVLPVIAKYEPAKVPGAMQDLAMAEYRGRAAAFQDSDPEIRTEIDPATGKEVSFSRTPRGWSRIPDDVATRQKAQNENQRRTAAFKSALEVRPDLVEFDANGVPSISPEKYAEAAKLAGFESGTKSGLEQQQIAGERVFRSGRKLMGLLDGNVGVPGAIKRGLAQVGLDKVFGVENASDAVAAQTVGREFVAQIFKALRSDSNINKDEVARLEAAAPDPTRLITTPKVEKAKLLSVLEGAFETSRANAQKMGTPITPMFLTMPEIEARISNGQLTAEQAAEIWENSATLLMEEIRAQIK